MDKLKPCPFCGSEAAEPIFIGNDHIKRRKVTIRCKAPGCTKGITVGAMRFSHEWCYQEAVKKWNNRAESPELTAANARIAYLEQLAAARLVQMTADAERIAEMGKALERTVDQAERCLNKACCAAVEKLTELAPQMGWDAGEETAKIHMRRVRAAALLKEKE